MSYHAVEHIKFSQLEISVRKTIVIIRVKQISIYVFIPIYIYIYRFIYILPTIFYHFTVITAFMHSCFILQNICIKYFGYSLSIFWLCGSSFQMHYRYLHILHGMKVSSLIIPGKWGIWNSCKYPFSVTCAEKDDRSGECDIDDAWFYRAMSVKAIQ